MASGDLVPNQATVAPRPYDEWPSAGKSELVVPEGKLPKETVRLLKQIVKLPPCRSWELKRLQRLHDGDPGIIHDTSMFPMPDAMTPGEWEACKRSAVYVNLVKPAVRRLTSGTYSKVTRTVEDRSPYKDELDELMGPGNSYSQDSRCWFENAALLDTAPRVWTFDSNNELESWLPNPIYSRITANPRNLKEKTGVFEFNPEGKELRFCTAEGWGILYGKGKVEFTGANLGFLPATIGYGHERTHRGELYGLSLVREAPDYSIRVTQVMLYLAILQKIYSRAQAVMKGQSTMEKPEEAFALHGVLEMPSDGDFFYRSPDAKFKETLDVVRQYIAILAIILSIPQDAFDASAIEPNQSAESAKMRNIPLSSLTAFLIEEWRRNEIDFARRAAALMQYRDTKKRVTMADIRKNVKLNIQMEPASIPESKTEEVASWIQLLQAGGKTPEDFARHFNTTKSEAEIIQMSGTIAERLAAVNAAPLSPDMPVAANAA
jgi:hypothetical protein